MDWLDAEIREAIVKLTGWKTAATTRTPDVTGPGGARHRGRGALSYPAAGMVADPEDRPELQESNAWLGISDVDVENLKTKKGIDVKKLVDLGEGAHGTAFAINDKTVIKITDDRAEAVASFSLIGKKNEHIVRIFDVFRFRNTRYYGIIQERLDRYNGARKFEKAFDLIDTIASLRYGRKGFETAIDSLDGSWEEIKNRALSRFETNVEVMSSMPPANVDRIVHRFYWAMKPILSAVENHSAAMDDVDRSLDFLESVGFGETIDELRENGIIDFYDFHSGNVMTRDQNSIVVIDLGANSKIKNPRPPPVLEVDDVTQQTRDLGSPTFSNKRGGKLNLWKDRDALMRNAGRLEKRGIDVGSLVELGKGSFGTAYDIGDGRVLKVTDDSDEAIASFHVMGERLKHVVRIEEVFRFRDSPLFGIIEEKLGKLPEGTRNRIRFAVLTLRRNDVDITFELVTGGWKKFTEAVRQQLRRWKHLDDGGERHDAIVEAYKIFRDLIKVPKIEKELGRFGVRFGDYHSGNLMMRGNDIVAIDLGVSRSPKVDVPVLEGGKALKTDRIPQANVQPTIDAFEEEVLSRIPYRSVEPVGSTGKKASSGDLDLALDTDASVDEVAGVVKELGYEFKIFKAMNIVSTRYPQRDPSGDVTDKFAQVDLMIGDPTWTKFRFYGPSDTESKYKGTHTIALGNGILRVLLNLGLSNKGGFDKDDPEKKYTKDLDSIVARLSTKSKERWTADDFLQPFETMWEKVKRSFDDDTVSKIKDYVVKFIESKKGNLQMPDELNESKKKGDDLGFGFNSEGYPLQDKYEFHDLPICVENKRGSVRKWYDENGDETGATEMHNDYGYIDGVKGSDKEEVDVYIGPDEDAEFVYVVHQTKKPEFTEYDEDKVMLGFSSEEEAREAYLVHYDDDRFYGGMSSMLFDDFVEKLRDKKPKITNESLVKEAKGIAHLEDLKPDQFMKFLKKYKDLELEGGLEVSEKVDGSAMLEFGLDKDGLWAGSKNMGPFHAAKDWPDKPMLSALRRAHEALESEGDAIRSAWPVEVQSFTSEILHTKIPNSIEYGPNVVMIHGVRLAAGGTTSEDEARKLAERVTSAANGKLTSGGEEWRFEYKPVINPRDVVVDVTAEFETLADVYDNLMAAYPDRLKAQGKDKYQTNLKNFKEVQLAVKKKLVGQLRRMKSVYGPEGGDVEGIVFRDLESDDLVKLVDKDYFTKLNQFMWKYRGLIGQGAKSGGKMEPGVFAKMMKRNIENVLGTNIASTQFTKRVAKYVGDFPPEADTADKRLDLVLARFIENENVMQKNFIKRFTNSLAAAESALAELKKKWEVDKRKGMVFTAKDDQENPYKTVRMDDLIIKRTDESFEDAEEAFDGIRKALESVTSMPKESQRVALMKIVMGDAKLEKLKGMMKLDELLVRRVFDVFEGSLFSRSTTSAPRAAELDTNVRDRRIAERVVKRYAEKLARSSQKIDVGSLRFIDSGTKGSTFDIGDGKRVLKVTNDRSEAIASLKLVRFQHLDHVVHVYDVFRFDKSMEVFGIVQEMLSPMKKDVESKFRQTMATLDVVIKGKDVITKIKHAGSDKFFAALEDGVRHYESTGKKEYASYLERAIGELKNVKIDQMAKELESAGIRFGDYHPGNIMMRGNDYVVTDIGMSEVDGGQEPPTLESVIFETVRAIFEDSRGNIKKFLGMTPELADKFHMMDKKNSFFLAKAFVWYFNEKHVDPEKWKGGWWKHYSKEMSTYDKRDEIDEILFNEWNDKVGERLRLIINKDKGAVDRITNSLKAGNNFREIFRNEEDRLDDLEAAKKDAIMTFSNGWFWLNLRTCDSRKEAEMMGHCGQDHGGVLVSLRDTNNKPHVTMTWNESKNVVSQFRGKENKAPVKKLWKYVLAFFEKTGAQLDETYFGRSTGETETLLAAIFDVTQKNKEKKIQKLVDSGKIIKTTNVTSKGKKRDFYWIFGEGKNYSEMGWYYMKDPTRNVSEDYRHVIVSPDKKKFIETDDLIDFASHRGSNLGAISDLMKVAKPTEVWIEPRNSYFSTDRNEAIAWFVYLIFTEFKNTKVVVEELNGKLRELPDYKSFVEEYFEEIDKHNPNIPPIPKTLESVVYETVRSIFEDSRGNIVRLLGVPKAFADRVHELDSKNSFVLAQIILHWYSEYAKIPGKKGKPLAGVTAHLKKLEAEEDEKVKFEEILQVLFSDKFGWFSTHQLGGDGNTVLQTSKKDPNFLKLMLSNLESGERYKNALHNAKSAENEKELAKKNTIMKFPDGMRWVDLKSSDSDYERRMMGHCGMDESGILISLRDKNNRPHVTMTLSSGNTITQIKGKENAPPHEKYWKYIISLFEKKSLIFDDGELSVMRPELADKLDDISKKNQEKHFSDKIKSGDVIQTEYEGWEGEGTRKMYWVKEENLGRNKGSDYWTLSYSPFDTDQYRKTVTVSGDGKSVSEAHILADFTKRNWQTVKDFLDVIKPEEVKIDAFRRVSYNLAPYESFVDKILREYRDIDLYMVDYDYDISNEEMRVKIDSIEMWRKMRDVFTKEGDNAFNRFFDDLAKKQGGGSIMREGKVDTVGLTIGRFQPFHRGHAEIIRQLASKFTKVVVVIGGNKRDKKNPFSYDLKVEMMQKSLPDVMPKVEVHRAEWKGKPSGYIPGVVSDIIADQNSSIGPDTAVNVMVGPDRFESMRKQFDSAKRLRDREDPEVDEMIFNPELFNISKLPEVKGSMDDADRISATRIRKALADNDRATVERLLDARLVSDPQGFDHIYAKLRKELGQVVKINEDPLFKTKDITGGGDKVTKTTAQKKPSQTNLTTRGRLTACEQTLQVNRERLREKGIDVDSLRELGEGSNGIAYGYGGKVFKVTTDESEARASFSIQGRQDLKHVVNIEEVFRFGRTPASIPVFGIIQEELTKISDKEKAGIDRSFSFVDKHRELVSAFRDNDWETVKNMIHEKLEEYFAHKVDAPKGSPEFENELRDRVERNFKFVTGLIENFDVPEMMKELQSVGIEFHDYHSGNIMKRGNDYVVLDLGVSQSRGGDPPVFETIMRSLVPVLEAFGGNTAGVPGSSISMGGVGRYAATGMRSQSSPWSSGMYKKYTDDDLEDVRDESVLREMPFPPGMKWNEWNPWSEGSRDIPWEPNAAEKLWSRLKAGPDEEVPYKEKRDIGPGEHRFAYEVGGDLAPPGEKKYDVFQDDNTWEVKAITSSHVDPKSSKKVGGKYNFRGSPGALAPFLLFAEVVKIVSALLKTFSELPQEVIQELRDALDIPMGFDKMMEVIDDNKQAVMGNNIAFRRTFGFSPKTKKGTKIVGLVEVLQQLSEAIRDIDQGVIDDLDDDIKSWVEKRFKGHKIEQVSILDRIKIARSLGVPEESIDEDIVAKVLARIPDDVLKDPYKLKSLWDSVKPREIFSKSTHFVIVDERAGYFPFEIDDINAYINFVGIAKDINLSLSKNVTKKLPK